MEFVVVFLSKSHRFQGFQRFFDTRKGFKFFIRSDIGKTLCIQESVHRNALSIAFENGYFENYKDLTDGITKGYLSQGVKMHYKKAVQIARFLRDKQMIILEDDGYRYNPDFQY